jgi:hypothetical protein
MIPLDMARVIRIVLPGMAATFRLPATLSPTAWPLEMLPSVTCFLACAAAALSPTAPSDTVGRFAVTAAEEERREAAMVDILTSGELVTAAPLSLSLDSDEQGEE